jgi:alkylation response protein AidB-like acyl-CoA dehydrogenase
MSVSSSPAPEIRGKLGLRVQATAELTFAGVRVPADALVGEEGSGFRYAMASPDKGRVPVAAGCTDIVQGCLEAVVSYAHERRQFGRQLASFQLIQDMIAEISVDADAVRPAVSFRLWQLTEPAPRPGARDRCRYRRGVDRPSLRYSVHVVATIRRPMQTMEVPCTA